MGRPPKLSDREKSEIVRRLARGETPAKLCKEFKISRSRFSELFSEKVPIVQGVATRLASAELELAALPITEQVSVRTLADQMKTASTSLAAAAVNGAQINERLTGLAVKRLGTITEESSPEDLKPIAALVATGNEASKTALALVNANKGQAQGETSLEDLLEQVNRRQRG